MRPFVIHRNTLRFVFIIGFLFLILGCTFLIGSLMEISQVTVLASLLLVFLGVTCAIFATGLKRRSQYLFFEALFVQAGLFFFFHTFNIIPVKISRTWPMLSIFSGIALFPAGWSRYGVPKVNYVVPSVAFVILGTVLMIFSFDLVSFSFAQFVKSWWHLILVLAGLTLVLFSVGVKQFGEPK